MSETAVGDKLAEAFPPAMLKSMSKGGTSLTYIPVAEVVARLNEVLGFDGWSYEITARWSTGERETKSGTYPLWCMATVRMSIGEARRDGTGGVQVKFLSDETGPVDLGDEWKGCVSDALKKAAQAFGVGLDIARKEEAKAAEKAERQREQVNAGARDLGWESVEEHNERFHALADRAKALDEESRAAVKKWFNDQGLKSPLTRDQTNAWEAQIADHEDHAERPFDVAPRSDAA